VGPHYRSIASDECGFGGTPRQAYHAYIKQVSGAVWWRKQSDFPPQFLEFKIEETA
jgi:hypothetical protein